MIRYHFVAVGTPGDVVDKTGEQHAVQNVTGFPKMKLATLDIDRTFVHWDNNKVKMEQLLADCKSPLACLAIALAFSTLALTRRESGDALLLPFADVGKVDLEVTGPPFFLLRVVDKSSGLSARRLTKKYGIETARDYAQRSRRGLNILRQHGQAVPGVL